MVPFAAGTSLLRKARLGAEPGANFESHELLG